MPRGRTAHRIARWFTLAASLAGCTNNPYPDHDQNKKVLYVSFDEAAKSLDPAVAYTTTAHEITGQVNDALLEYHYLKRPYELMPALASAIPKAEPRAGGQVAYTFELRPDLWFQNDPCFALGGADRKTRPILAEDIAFEILRIADPEVNSPVIEPFSNLVGFRAFSTKLAALSKRDPGFKRLPARERYARAGSFPGVRALDASHLEITLESAYPQILYWFAMPFTTPVPWEAIEYYTGRDDKPPIADHPVSSGPYMLTRYDKQSRIVLEKNPNWYGIRHPEWKAPGATYPSEGESSDIGSPVLAPSLVGKPLPFIERIEFRREKEAIPAFNKFLQGYYDAAAIIRESFDKVVREDRLSPEMQALGMQLNKSVTTGIYYIGFNMQDRTVGDKAGQRSKKLRQAMSLVIDVKEYTRLFLNGRGVPADSVLAPGIFGYDPEYKNPYRHVDLERGKKLLVEAGYPGGIDPETKRPIHLTFDVADPSPDRRLQYQFFVNAWRQLGVDVEIAGTNYNKFQEKIRDGAYQIFMWGWIGDYPDAENFLFLLWSEMARSKNNGPNTANFANAEFDRLFLALKSRENDAERLQLIQQARAILEDERPWIELFYPESYSLFQGWLHGVKAPGLSVPTVKYHDLDPDTRAQRRFAWNRPVVWPAYALALLAVLIVAPGVRTFFRERQ